MASWRDHNGFSHDLLSLDVGGCAHAGFGYGSFWLTLFGAVRDIVIKKIPQN